MYEFVIEDIHFQYLVLQRGGLSHIKDLKEFTAGYSQRTHEQFQELLPYIPSSAKKILDIGSGLGGIDVLLSHHYKGAATVELFDGMDDPPVHKLSYKTFNNMSVAKDFLEKNGVNNYKFSSPGKYEPEKKDLIISKASYCFHYDPHTYINNVILSCKKGTILIFDVRTNRNFEEYLSGFFSFVAAINTAETGKYRTLAFEYK
jgi:SAM-dependent methyltransferase